jgi:SAM-dependent methyltransferase
MSGVWSRLRRAARRAREIGASRSRQGRVCANCGFRGQPLHRPALWPELVAQWELSPQWAQWMDEREGSRCAWCGSSLRSSGLAAAIVLAVNARHGTRATRLRSLFRDRRARSLSIAEINSAGNLHRVLAACPGLRYSEFGSRQPNVPSQDLSALTYTDASFDLVITSDTLEHVPDIERALAEIHRVLKPGGAHVFTVPVVWDRASRRRARLVDGQVVHLLPPSHHGDPLSGAADFLVFHEFGADFPELCTRAGFKLELLRDAANPALVTFIARRAA